MGRDGCAGRMLARTPCDAHTPQHSSDPQALPLYLAGVSSGAAFALKLPMALGRPVAGVISGGRWLLPQHQRRSDHSVLPRASEGMLAAG